MEINFEPVNFQVNQQGELEYHGPAVKIYSEFRFMSKEQKLDILILLKNWTDNQIESLNK